MIKRNRPRPNNGGMRQHRPHQNGYSNPSSRNDESSEVRLKNRGYYQQMFDKYTTAARESLSLGERIEAEGHYQHAEHYLRQLNDRIKYDNEAQQQQQMWQRVVDEHRHVYRTPPKGYPKGYPTPWGWDTQSSRGVPKVGIPPGVYHTPMSPPTGGIG